VIEVLQEPRLASTALSWWAAINLPNRYLAPIRHEVYPDEAGHQTVALNVMCSFAVYTMLRRARSSPKASL